MASSSLDTLSDREVDQRIARALGRFIPPYEDMKAEAEATWREQIYCRYFSALGGFEARQDAQSGAVMCVPAVPRYAEQPAVFEGYVIPALEARGLGEKYVDMLSETLMNLDGGTNSFLELLWRVTKAPLSLRARAALSVLQSQESNG